MSGFAVRLEGVQQLSVETVTSNSVRVRWTGVEGARGYRVVWGPFTGHHFMFPYFLVATFVKLTWQKFIYINAHLKCNISLTSGTLLISVYVNSTEAVHSYYITLFVCLFFRK